jgi:glycosyltransferase involved in cell wall biosynthesis
MKTIVQIVQHLRPGGIETMALDLHDFFARKGDKSYIISLEGDAETALENWPRLQAHRSHILFLGKPDRFSPAFLLRLIGVLRKLKPRVLHTHHIGPLLYGGLASKVLGIKVQVHTEHDAWHLENPRHRRLQQWLLRICRPRLVADADSVGQALRQYLNLNQLTVIRNGIDTSRFVTGDAIRAREAFGLPQDIKLLGCSGRLEMLKGQRLLIESLLDLPVSVHVVLAGSGSCEEVLREQAAALGVASRVHFLGRVDDMPRFYQALDFFCLPSYKEGMPLSPLEAQACGVPSIVTDVGGASESLCRDTGTLIPAGSIPDIVNAVERLLNKTLADSPRTFVTENADIQHMAEAYYRLHYRGIPQE